MKQVFVIGGLTVLALTAATVRPASADECRDGRYVAPVVAYNRVVVDRNCNVPFVQQFNRDTAGIMTGTTATTGTTGTGTIAGTGTTAGKGTCSL